MISSQILQNTIDELHGITRVDFAVMDTEGNEVATTMQPDFISGRSSVCHSGAYRIAPKTGL